MSQAGPAPRLERALGGLAVLTLLVGLGSTRLTYHEAIVAQVAREMIARRAYLVPTLGGVPWLEKPPLAFWLVAGLGRVVGRVDETVARLPAVVGALALAFFVARLAARRWGRAAGVLAGAVQITTAWTVFHGRLAEVDMLLAALVAGCLVEFDGVRGRGTTREGAKAQRRRRLSRRPSSELCVFAPSARSSSFSVSPL